MKIRRLIPALAIAILLTACGKEDDIEILDDYGEVIEQDQPVAESSESTEAPAEDVQFLTDDELSEFTALFNTPEYYGFLREPFTSGDNINWNAVLQDGAGINVTDISAQELEDYKTATKKRYISKYSDIIGIRKSDLEEFAKLHLGTSFNPDNGKFDWDYVEAHDSYYTLDWVDEEKPFTCIAGQRTGDVYTLRFESGEDYHYARNADRVITFTKTDDVLMMQSNEIQWEDFSNQSQTFDVELKPGDGQVRFITYAEDSGNGLQMVIIKDGELKHSFLEYISRGDQSGYLRKVEAVSFFDFNADGVKDIVIIGDSDIGPCIAIEESINDYYGYETCYYLEEAVEKELGSDFSVNGVKSVLLGDNTDGEFADYREAYAQIAKLYNMGGDSYKYDLIYGDDDDIPELVIDTPGYRVSLYTYADGRAQCLMHDWAYGAMGNYGYSYVPGKSIYYNHNTDHAGAIHYDSYMLPHPGRELIADFYTESYYFDDVDRDGSPSAEELEAVDEFKLYETIYFCVTDPDMSEEELEAKITEFENYGYEDISGSMEYEELMQALTE